MNKQMGNFLYRCIHFFGWVFISKFVLWKIALLLQTLPGAQQVHPPTVFAQAHLFLSAVFYFGVIFASIRFYYGVWISGTLIR